MIDLSIVTVTKNDCDLLKSTLNSVRSEKILGVEYILIDGNSTDTTKKVVKSNMDIIDKFITENDNGIYDAMNKGLKMSHGSHVLFLNSGDELLNLKKIISDIQVIDLSKMQIFLYASSYSWSDSMFKVIEPRFSFCSMPTSHQAIIFPSEIAKSLMYDTSYKFSADYDLYLKIHHDYKIPINVNNEVIVKTAPVGYTEISISAYLKECFEINWKYENKFLALLRYIIEFSKFQIKSLLHLLFSKTIISNIRKLRGGSY
jgi:glycosyltransferase involved in cell wall biosynthesis